MSEHPIRYVDEPDVTIDESKVPEKFRHLLPWARQWSIGDDVIRAEVMDQTPYEEKKAFVEAVSPYIEEIFVWTDSYHKKGGPIPDEVVIFEMIWEPCEEAALDVGHEVE